MEPINLDEWLVYYEPLPGINPGKGPTSDVWNSVSWLVSRELEPINLDDVFEYVMEDADR